VTFRIRSVGWVVSTKMTSSPPTALVVGVSFVNSTATGAAASGVPTVQVRVCVIRGPFRNAGSRTKSF
jgi:hypothetical protein